MKRKIINWLKAHGTVYQEDYIEIVYYQNEHNQRVTYDIDWNVFYLVEYRPDGSILEVEQMETDKELQTIIEIFGI